MSVNRGGLRVATHIFEAAAWHYSVKVSCSRCPHSAVFEAAGLWWLFHRRGWDDHLAVAREHFWCTKCAAGNGVRIKAGKLDLVHEEATRTLPSPDEREWKRAISRFRS